MEETTDQQNNPHLQVSEKEGEATPFFIDKMDNDATEDDEKDANKRGASRKVWYGLWMVLVASVIAGVLLLLLLLLSSKGNNRRSYPTDDGDGYLSRTELLARVVLPGVDVSNLTSNSSIHKKSPQFLALEWLVNDDPRNMTIEDDPTELIERFSLVTLYFATGGGGWLRDNGWLKSPSHCDWIKVRCDDDDDDENGRGRLVTGLMFMNNNMSGTLPAPEIGNFRKLRFIDFSFNSVGGTIPTEVGLLTSATYLDLRSNLLEGTLPSTQIGNNLKRLEQLKVNMNQFLGGTIPKEIGKLQQLESLDLSQSNFSGTIPSEIGNLRKLSEFVLNGNAFSGSIPSQIGNLQQLYWLALDSNSFTGNIPTKIGNTGLTMPLNISHNFFSGTIPIEIGELRNVRGLDFRNNFISGTIPSEIGNLRQLKGLDLSINSLSGTIPSEIGKLQQLISLFLASNTQLTGIVPKEVGQLESIRNANFQNTSLTGGLDDLAFCNNSDSVFFTLEADCGGANPKINITCECCTKCW